MSRPRAISLLLIAVLGVLGGSLAACSSAPVATPTEQRHLQSDADLVAQALNATSTDLHVSTATLVNFSTANSRNQVELRAKAKTAPHLFVQLDFSVPHLDTAKGTVTVTSAGCHIVVTAHSDPSAQASLGKLTCP